LSSQSRGKAEEKQRKSREKYEGKKVKRGGKPFPQIVSI
jgi:hypothetical protein